MTTGALVLAAGRARRFGSDKRLAKLPGGGSVIAQTLTRITEAGLPVLLCVPDLDDLPAQLPVPAQVRVLRCARAGEGMGATLAEGMAQLPAEWDAVLVCLADMPWVRVATYRALADASAVDRICRPVHAQRPGNPVAFGRDFFPQLCELAGDVGAKPLVAASADRVQPVEVNDPGIHVDIDLPADITARPAP